MAASESKLLAEAMSRLSAEEKANLPKNLDTHKKLTASQKGALEKLKSIKAKLKKEGWGDDAQEDFKEADLEAQKIIAAKEESKALDALKPADTQLSLESATPNASVASVGGKDMFLQLRQKYHGDAEKAFFEYCFRTNLIYDRFVWDDIVSNGGSEYMDSLPESYEKTINADPKYKDRTFFGQIKLGNFVDLTQDDLVEDGLTETDKEHRTKIIKITGYDPFLKDKPEYRPDMYRALATMLTEDMKNDVPKQKAAISIVQNYANIDKYQKILDAMVEHSSGSDDNKQVKDLSDMIAKMQASVNQTAKENNFTGSKALSGGKGTLSSVMDKANQSGIDDGITNFYDIKTSASFKQVADKSFAAMLDQLKLQDSDYREILAGQAKLVKEAIRVSWMSREALRLAKKEIKKQDLLNELALEYRAKGLSEKDIDDYLSKEYILHSDIHNTEIVKPQSMESGDMKSHPVVDVPSAAPIEPKTEEEAPSAEPQRTIELPKDW
jgi:hypothetical protein